MDSDISDGKMGVQCELVQSVRLVQGGVKVRGWWNSDGNVTGNVGSDMAEWIRVLDIKIWRSLDQILHPNAIYSL